jgi:hypothetical protein
VPQGYRTTDLGLLPDYGGVLLIIVLLLPLMLLFLTLFLLVADNKPRISIFSALTKPSLAYEASDLTFFLGFLTSLP